LTGEQFANYWIHNGLIKVNGQKMSKSLGNSLFLKDLLDAYSPETIKFALLQTNYRGDINVTDNLFPDAEKHLYEFYKIMLAVENAFGVSDGGNADIDQSFDNAMDDDFNTALAISNLFGLFKGIKTKLNAGDKSASDDVNQIRKTYSLIGLFGTDAKEFVEYYQSKNTQAIPQEVIALAEERLKARAEKDWAKSDELRNAIAELGYDVKDGKGEYTLTKKQ
jgi:cysteinyl-tRNA synthetase